MNTLGTVFVHVMLLLFSFFLTAMLFQWLRAPRNTDAPDNGGDDK